MICLSCPNCGAALEFADDRAGIETACYACYQPITVPAAPLVNPVRLPEPAPHAAADSVTSWSAESRGDPWQVNDSPLAYSPEDGSELTTLRRLLLGRTGAMLLGLAVAVTVGVVGLRMSGGDVYIYVDNGSQEPMVVTLDGKEEATVAPGCFQTFKCAPGEKRLLVRCGEQVLFDGVKDLQKPDKIATNRRYFFNPDNRNRYRTFTVKYGSSPLEGLFKPDPDSPPADRRNAIRLAYEKLAAEPELLPPDPWFEVPNGAYVLTPAPESVTTRGFTERRVIMARVEPKDYTFIEAARKNKDPSEKDLKALIEVVDRVLESEP